MTAFKGSTAATIALLAVLLAPTAAAAQTDSGLERRLDRLERLLDNKGLLELAHQVQQLQNEVRELRGELENQGYALEQVRKGQRDVYTNLDRRLSLLEQAGTISRAPGEVAGTTAPGGAVPSDPPLPTLSAPGQDEVAGEPSRQSIAVDLQAGPGAGEGSAAGAATAGAGGGAAEAASEGGPEAGAADTLAAAAPAAEPGAEAGPSVVPEPSLEPRGPTSDSPESEAAYREAFGMLKAGRYEDSIAAFDKFLQQYPNSQYADNAQYWLGEAYYVMRQFEPAIEQYQKLIENYPDSQKRSHALLKIAYGYSELGLDDKALAVLDELKQRFPGSAAARLADERIQRIHARGPERP